MRIEPYFQAFFDPFALHVQIGQSETGTKGREILPLFSLFKNYIARAFFSMHVGGSGL